MVIEPGLRASHMEDVYDFYKPTMASEYPRVDGHLSNACYLRALDGCYTRYAERYEKRMGAPFTLDAADYAVFHAPYNKLVQKSFGRYLYNDYKTGKSDTDLGFAQFDGLTPDETYTDRTFLKHLVTVSKDHYQRMVQPSELITSRFGLARLSLCCASGVMLLFSSPPSRELAQPPMSSLHISACCYSAIARPCRAMRQQLLWLDLRGTSVVGEQLRARPAGQASTSFLVRLWPGGHAVLSQV
jgi:hydroxymethylglutaryl-CoA synthase